jgi:oligosaccharide reducing-end xylanase
LQNNLTPNIMKINYLQKLFMLGFILQLSNMYAQTPLTPTPEIPALGAVESGVYRNMFVEAGYTQDQSNTKIDNTYNLYFTPGGSNALFYPVGTDMAYIWSVDSNDVRSEGMSYGMMICLQMNDQEKFNKIWKWAYTFSRHATGARAGHFAWQCTTAGVKKDNSSASDGEEYFVTALFFAAKRWGNGEGIFDYQTQANELLTVMQNKPSTGTGGVTNFFNLDNKQVVFVPNTGQASSFTDPSYHLPAFYEVWAAAAETNNDFWSDAATTSRDYFLTTANATTGLMADYANFDGTPYTTSINGGTTHQHALFDSYRCSMNMALDYTWYKKSDNEKALCELRQTFFNSKGISNYPSLWQLDGTEYTASGTFHAGGLVGCNGVGSLASDKELAWDFVKQVYTTSPPSGLYRYYDGLLYMMSLLQVAGEFQAYIPTKRGLGVNENEIVNLKSSPNPVTSTYTISNSGIIDTVEVSNVLGQKISSKKYNSNTVQVDFSNLANGIYFVKIASENKVSTIKVEKN